MLDGMPGTDDWQAIARTADPDDLRERILTGYKAGKPFTPYVPTIDLPSDVDWVLDFGCGVGRSFPYLTTMARHVAGFDLAPMIERCRALAAHAVDLLSDDWREISTRRFDLIYAALVLQHLDPDTCRRYLTAFAAMAPATYLLTRLQSDFDANVLGLVAEIDLFDVQTCVEVAHDPERHQLRRVGVRSFDDLVGSSDNGHYEVLMRRRGGSVRRV